MKDTKKAENTKTVTTETAVMHKVFTGKVVSLKRTKTVGVSVPRVITHAKYGKQMKRSTTLAVHNENLALSLGDTVKISACRPISKTKHFTVIEKLN
jgi:small subunit ribosomal protein S17